jgi:TRAP-type C4-dicarboxylate transport system permease small subunit
MPERLTRRVLSAATLVGGAALVGMMSLTVLDICLRFGLGSPIAGTFEVTELAMIGIAFLGLGQAQHQHQHITIDLVYELVGDSGQRLLERAARSVSLVLVVVIGWQLWAYLLGARADHQVSGVLGLPVYAVVGVSVVGFGLYALALLTGSREAAHVA